MGIKKTILISTFVVQVIFPAFASAECDATILNALRTKYDGLENKTISESLYHLACSSSSSNKEAKFGIKRTDFALDSGFKSKSTSETCETKDYQYYEQNKYQIAYSFVPEQAILACVGGLSFTAKSEPSSNTIVVRAAYVNNVNTKPLKVKEIQVPDDTMVKCRDPWPKGTEISPQGTLFQCERLKNDSLTFLLKTEDNHGDRSITLPRVPIYESGEIEWSHIVDTSYTTPTSDFFYKCKITNRDILVGSWQDCRTIGVCHKTSSEKMATWCNTRWGSTYHLRDGELIYPERSTD